MADRKKVNHNTARNVVAIIEVFILNNVTPTDDLVFANCVSLTISEIRKAAAISIPKHTIRRIMLMLEKNDYAFASDYGHRFAPQTFDTEFFCSKNQLGFNDRCPAQQGDIDVSLCTLLRVFNDVIEEIKERGLCDNKQKEPK